MRKKTLHTLSRLVKSKLDEKRAVYARFLEEKDAIEAELLAIQHHMSLSLGRSVHWSLCFMYTPHAEKEREHLKKHYRAVSLKADQMQNEIQALYSEKKGYDIRLERMQLEYIQEQRAQEQKKLDETASFFSRASLLQ